MGRNNTHLGVRVASRTFLLDLNQIWISQQIFMKFHRNPSSGIPAYTSGRTDGHDEASRRSLRNCANAPDKKKSHALSYRLSECSQASPACPSGDNRFTRGFRLLPHAVQLSPLLFWCVTQLRLVVVHRPVHMAPTCPAEISTYGASKPKRAKTWRILYTWVRASWIEFNNCPTRWDFFSLLYFCRQLYMFRVLTPIIRSSYSCNYSFWY